MSRIDEALRRLTGSVSPEPRKPHSLDGFASEGEVSHKADESRRAKDPRKVAFIVPATGQAEQRAVPASSAPASPAAPAAQAAAEAPVVRQAERVMEHVEADAEVDRLIDVRQIADYTGFVLRSVGRHKLLTGATCAGVLLLAALAALLYPRTYHVEVKLLAQRNAVMTALSNPGRAVPWDADAPTRAAAETVLRRDNLISLVTQTDLINEWDRRRPAIMRFKDWLMATVTRHELTASDKLDAIVWRLENYMLVTAGPVGDGTVTIELYWPDGETAYRIVERARQSFLEARQAAETSAISESIAILERHSASLNEVVNRTLTDLARTGQGRNTADAPSVAPVARPRRAVTPVTAAVESVTANLGAVDAPPAPNPQLVRARTQLQEKQDELAKLQAARQTALTTAQNTISALLTVYTASHPNVLNEQTKLAALQKESPQVLALKTQIQELEVKFDEMENADRERIEKELDKQRATAPAVRPSAPVVAQRAPAAAATEEPAAPAPLRPTQASAFADLRLRTELGQLQSILERTDGARIELAVSEAAFKYRYTVIKPAQVPRDPESPNLRLMAVAGLMAALLLAVGAAVAKDLISNRIVEAWQVERQLGLPILGNVRLV